LKEDLLSMTEMEKTLSLSSPSTEPRLSCLDTMALDLPHTITTTTTNEDYDDDLFGNNGPENKTVGLQQLTEQHHRDLTYGAERRKGIARKDPPGTPDLAARSTETRQAEEMRIADGEEEEEEEE
jgi:hypothetical protein